MKPHLLGCILLLVYISQVYALPLAIFYYLPVGNKITFRADLSVGNIKQYVWDFGDGSDPASTTESSINYYYPSAGMWKVTLTVTDNNNKRATVQNLVLSPTNSIPTCDFKVSAVKDDDLSLDASGSRDRDGNVAWYMWDMNDGNQVIITNSSLFNYTYLKGGYYNISLTVKDNSNAVSINTCLLKRVFVNRSPLVNFTVSVNDHMMIFDGSASTDADGHIQSSKWIFGDGDIEESNTPLLTSAHNYVLSGYYNVTFIITDNLGSSSALTQLILIDIAPRPEFQVVFNKDDLITLNAVKTWTDNNSQIVDLLWDWGDGSTSITHNFSQDAQHAYSWGAYYNISVKVTDNYSKKGQYSQILLVNAIPRVSFEVTKKINDTIHLQSKAFDLDGNLTIFAWTFGDGNQDFGSEVQHTFTQAGTYNVCLTVRDNLDAQNISCQNVFVNRLPTAKFAVASNVNDSVVLIDNGSQDFDGSIVDYSWNWGDGIIEMTGSHNYTLGGFYNVSLKVTDNLGGEDITWELLRVNAPPIADFEITQIVNNTITIDSSISSDVDGVILDYSWSFGDGESRLTNTSSIFSHHYRFGGNYLITLNVTDNMGDTSCYSYLVFVDIPPFADFEIVGVLEHDWVIVSAKPYLSRRGNTFDFDGQLSSLIWNFGDNSSNISNSTNSAQMHQYRIGGDYTITLYAQDNNGIYSQKAQRNVFIDNPPIPAFIVANIDDGLITLNASSSYDIDGSVTTYCWNFNDGTEINCQDDNSTIQYAYSKSGTHTISLTVIDNLGVESSFAVNQTVTVNQSPVAFFEIIDSLPTGIVVFNFIESQDLDGQIVKYVWDFGDGTFSTSYNTKTSQIQHLYQTSGLFQVTLIVYDNEGASSNASFPAFAFIPSSDDISAIPALDPSSENFLKQANLTIESYTPNELPVANIQFWVQNQTVFLSGQASSDSDGSIISYIWSLGDGTSSTEMTLNHTFIRGGPYNISLTVKDDAGAITSTFKMITLNYLPTAGFTFKILTGTTVNLDASKSFDIDGSIAYYNWTFGDGNKLSKTTQPSLNYTYPASGIYTISLSIEDNDGAQSFYIQNLNLQKTSTPPSRILVQNGLPYFALLLNVKLNQYLALSYNSNLTHSNIILRDNQFMIKDNENNNIIDPYFMLYQNYQTRSYYIMNQNNGLALTVGTTGQLAATQQGPQTSTFQIYSFGNFYQILDANTGKYMVLTQDGVELVSIPSGNNHLWNIAVPPSPAYKNLPLN